MSTPNPAPLPVTASQLREWVESARARAEGYLWGVLHIHHPDTADARTATAFADAYATRVAALLAEGRQPPTLGRAWVGWREEGDVTAELTAAPATHDQAPTPEQYDPALHERSALWLCIEAVGYARGWCDAAGIGSGDAVDFGHAYAVLVAAGGTRLNIADTWTNWRHGHPLHTYPRSQTPATTQRASAPQGQESS
ncbi:hypothetical protein ACFWFQ_17200 [Nocardia salmonicida]|uniref:hypothetical protein n=1 Tax=Nocardia salmonicida TaxID=53431 RepID=UPI00364B6452